MWAIETPKACACIRAFQRIMEGLDTIKISGVYVRAFVRFSNNDEQQWLYFLTGR